MSEYSMYRNNGTAARNTKTLREYEKNEAKERKRSLLYLICSYLQECNLQESADAVTREAQLNNQYEVCDNVDLDIVLQDYQSYYYTKFNKTPKILKKTGLEYALASDTNKLNATKKKSRSNNTSGVPPVKESNDSPLAFQIDITSLGNKRVDSDVQEKKQEENLISRASLCDFHGYTPEWREMADLITKEIVPKKLGLNWRDCVGVQETVELLKEAVVYPLKYPDLFTGLLTPWKGVLLYGPPGTGKTLLAKALAGETTTTFINLSISTLVSKWRGDSEKLLKVLFDVARLYAPTTIFIDELDAVASKYEDHQHDASRRFKSELLVQLDGILGGNERIFVLAATNLPWNLNSAILRRFEKRILLNVPSSAARVDLFGHYFSQHQNETDFNIGDYKSMAEITDYYSGADIKLVCKEVLMNTLRSRLNYTFGKCEKLPKKLSLDDVKRAVKKMRPTSTHEMIDKYIDWAAKHGSV